ncbi:MAG: YggT family protein [Gammaproteobacteria bacterium]|nr:MAG: YggT family protein [Gammaproteobacteria bacterium]
MGENYIVQALQFLVQTLFGLYIVVVMARFLLQQARADFHNPISKFVVSATQPLLRPLRRVIPSIGRIDTSSLVLMLALQMLKMLILYALLGHIPAVAGLMVGSIAELLNLAINFYVVLLLILVVASWVGGGGYHSLLALVGQLCEPILRPLRRIIPPIGMFDLSVFAAFILLQLAKILLVAPLLDVSRQLM